MNEWTTQHSIEHIVAPAESHRLALVERRHVTLRRAIEIYMGDMKVSGPSGIRQSADLRGSSTQWHRELPATALPNGCSARCPDFLVDLPQDGLSPAHLGDHDQFEQLLLLILRQRAAAKKALISADLDAKLRRALLQQYPGSDLPLKQLTIRPIGQDSMAWTCQNRPGRVLQGREARALLAGFQDSVDPLLTAPCASRLHCSWHSTVWCPRSSTRSCLTSLTWCHKVPALLPSSSATPLQSPTLEAEIFQLDGPLTSMALSSSMPTTSMTTARSELGAWFAIICIPDIAIMTSPRRRTVPLSWSSWIQFGSRWCAFPMASSGHNSPLWLCGCAQQGRLDWPDGLSTDRCCSKGLGNVCLHTRKEGGKTGEACSHQEEGILWAQRTWTHHFPP